MDALYERGAATAREVCSSIADPPSATAVRTLLRILKAKGHVSCTNCGRAKLYRPKRASSRAGRVALRHAVQTFSGGSAADAMATLLRDYRRTLTAEELDDLIRMIGDKGRDRE